MRRDTKIAAVVFALTAAFILFASLGCTWAIAHGASIQWRLLFRPLCHGIVHRCLYVWGVPMPICARCTGIYAGMLGGILVFALAHAWVRSKVMKVAMAVTALAMALDGGTQALRLRESTNTLRLATGIPLAFFFLLWALSVIEEGSGAAGETPAVQNDAPGVT